MIIKPVLMSKTSGRRREVQRKVADTRQGGKGEVWEPGNMRARTNE